MPHFLYIPLDNQVKRAKPCPCTLESQKLEDTPEQGQCISFLGSQVESCVRFLVLCLVLHQDPESPYGYLCLFPLQKKHLSHHKGTIWRTLVVSPQYFITAR